MVSEIDEHHFESTKIALLEKFYLTFGDITPESMAKFHWKFMAEAEEKNKGLSFVNFNLGLLDYFWKYMD